MDYADFSDAKSSKKKLTALSVVLALAIALTLLTKAVLEPMYEELKVSLESTSALARQITSAETEKDGYEQTLEDSGRFSATSYLTKNLTYPSSVKQRLPTS